MVMHTSSKAILQSLRSLAVLRLAGPEFPQVKLQKVWIV